MPRQYLPKESNPFRENIPIRVGSADALFKDPDLTRQIESARRYADWLEELRREQEGEAVA